MIIEMNMLDKDRSAARQTSPKGKLRVLHKPRAVIDIGDQKRFLGFPIDSNRWSMG
jgi:hypothetical protein